MKGSTTSSPIAFVWAGLVIGGSLIAAPAKFTAPSLTLPIALEVGRAQFQWVGIGEAVLCGALVVAVAFGWRSLRISQLAMIAIPIVIFGIQQLILMPILDARTLRIIAGETLAPSQLHDVFVVLEVGKVLALLAAGALTRPSRMPDTSSD